MDSKTMEYMIHHVFLPPKLPGEGHDSLQNTKDHALISRVTKSLLEFRDCIDDSEASGFMLVLDSIKNLATLIDPEGPAMDETLQSLLPKLSSDGQSLPIYIAAQNAGILVRHTGNKVVFETMELVPPNSVVMNTQGRIKRVFPGDAAAVDTISFADTDFIRVMSRTLSKLSIQSVPEMLSKAKKAGTDQVEERDTTNPAMVTKFLTGYLCGVGSPSTPPCLWKNTREEVMWSNARLAWHRSPVWLLARVAMQTSFVRNVRDTGPTLYKEAMAFFMAQILEDAIAMQGQVIESEFIHCMISKIYRRIKKLADTYGHDRLSSRHWYPTVIQILSQAETRLKMRWKEVEQAFDQPVTNTTLALLNFEQDTPAILTDLDNYIHKILHPEAVLNTEKFYPTPRVAILPGPVLPSKAIPEPVQDTIKHYEMHCLAAIETWVEVHLKDWLHDNQHQVTTCELVYGLLCSYHQQASVLYKMDPEGMSLMILTCLELWVAIDKSATAIHPLLLEYGPCVQMDLCQCLLLPLQSQMDRLSGIESYVMERTEQSRASCPNVLSGFGTSRAFAVRYFASSETHQRLMNKITADAAAQKAEKLEEYHEKKQEYSSIMKEYESLRCTYETEATDVPKHHPKCRKCICKNTATSLNIRVFEWPLPEDAQQAQATVFELDRPPAFGSWRDATMYLLMDVMNLQYDEANKPQTQYEPSSCLQQYERTAPLRVRLLSEKKPTTRTHRDSYRVDLASPSTICVRNGLQYQYFDQNVGCFVKKQVDNGKLSYMCMHTVPETSSELQQFLCRPHTQPNGPEPNVVISAQSSCPTSMSLEEFKALASIPYGTRTQWSNLLAQLALPSIDFKKVETYLVILQTIHQAGPPCSSTMDVKFAREGHQDLQEPDFRCRLAQCLQNALGRILESWDSYQSLATFVAISNRLESMVCPHDDYQITEHCRDIAMRWMMILREKAQSATDPSVRTEFLRRVFELALIGTATFDSDELHLKKTLDNPDTARSLLRFYISIDDTFHAAYDARNSVLIMAYRRWTRLATRALPILSKLIVDKHSTCLSDAVGLVWAEYKEVKSWKRCPCAEHWLRSKSLKNGSSSASRQTVHFNLLTGELLVEGVPLSRLPSHYENQGSYQQLFGNASIEVIPTQQPGMSFSSIQKFLGYQLYFGTDTGGDLKLTCTKNDSTWDLIPRHVLEDKVPSHFLVNFAHWYHRNTGTIEFRSLKEPWVLRPSLWTLHRLLPKSNAAPRWKMMQGESYLVIDRTSKTASEMARVFASVETISHLHLTYDRKMDVLEVKLPRLGIQFHIRSQTSQLNSRECRGMYLDTDTCLGTLIGLTSKLVLRSSTGKRTVLIPEGDVAWEAAMGHTTVSTISGKCDKIHLYTVDDRLGCLIDNSSVQSKLFLCYLHALTSYCVQDRLTKITGTERALEILGEADIPSAARLKQENVNLLHKIADLSPRRRFYPRKMCVMQEVEWDRKLSFLSQHAELYFRSRDLLYDAARREFFHQGETALDGLDTLACEDTNSSHLLRRDAIRASTFYRASSGGNHFTTQKDSIYTERPSANQRLDERQSASYFSTVRIVRGYDTVQYPHDLSLRDSLFSRLSHYEILGQQHTLAEPLAYDADYIEEPMEKLTTIWWLLHQLLQDQEPTRFDFAMFVSTLAFSGNTCLQVVQALSAMYTNHSARCIVLPKGCSFNLKQGHEATLFEVSRTVGNHATAYGMSSESRMARLPGESKNKARIRKQQLFNSRSNKALSKFSEFVADQWPCEQPQAPISEAIDEYFIVDTAMDILRYRFQSWWKNRDFFWYLEGLSRAILVIPHTNLPPPVFTRSIPAEPGARMRAYMETHDLFMLPAPKANSPHQSHGADPAMKQGEPMQIDNPALPGLNALSSRLASMANQPFKVAYVENFRTSIACIETHAPSMDHDQLSARNEKDCCLNLAAAEQRLEAFYRQLLDSTVHSLPAYQRYNAPSPSTLLFISQLSHKTWPRISSDWQKAIVAFACAITGVQRASRILSVCHNEADLTRELTNMGHENWNPLDNPEILLQEIMGGILARRNQIEIAKIMASPPGAQNAAMQLNMGEGKSSVIVPIVAASLANGSCLVTVIVGKPQSKQMLQMLVSKLGGLSGRRIYHLPFSRSLKLDEGHYETIHKLCKECKDSGGILLVQPEHLLSFQLAGPEKGVCGNDILSSSALETQQFLDNYSRFIVDESDENFSVKFELTYTMGTQSNVELSPDRWVLIQAVLDIVREVAPLIQQELPLSIDIEQGYAGGSFPRVRILREDGNDQLCKLVAERVCQNGIHGLPIGRQSPAVREAIKRYMTESRPSPSTISTVETCQSFWTEAVKPRLYLLRGLLGQGVLGFALKSKRWRVNYGVDTSRQPPQQLAVPFRAKDSPAPQSEFSHSDVVIVLTCLSYYYGGLSDDELFSSFEHLALSDQATATYSDWVRGVSPDMPDAFRNLSGVNTKDRHQCKEQVFPYLKRSKGAIDFFLAKIVFPRAMKEFPHKLSASGWDIGKIKAHPTAGFSGTSDSQHFLPLSVKHLDLPDQRHTNALVLMYLLRPENTVVYMSDGNGVNHQPTDTVSSTDRLLRLIVDAKPCTQVILDAGAQILELSNVEMARQWLLLDKSNKEAVVYCGDNDEVMIIDKSGRIEIFQTSPFAKQLDRCLVFLDEAHTRGIDLKLPQYYRAAVTLGANLTKDRLVQACMRMRQLGKGQSVTFYVTKEIQDKIASVHGFSDLHKNTCTVADILAWTISETWADLSRNIPLWAVQGARFTKQKQIWAEAHEKGALTQTCASKFLEKEAMSLADHYAPLEHTVQDSISRETPAAEYLGAVFGGRGNAVAQSCLPELERIVERCRQFDAHQHAGTSALHEEQERELAPEIENEKQVQRPPHLEPAVHAIHPDILAFVRTGRLRDDWLAPSQVTSGVSAAYISVVPAFWSLVNTSAAKHLDVGQFPRRGCLYVSGDFARTVIMPSGGSVNHGDAYLRPVQWILTQRKNDANGTIEAMVIISPYEAQVLLPEVKKAQSRVFLSLYAPRPSQEFAAIDHLQLYTVPRPSLQGSAVEFDHDATGRFSVQLNLFAGQLYFGSKAEYKSACKYLGLASEASTDESTVVGADGFIISGRGKSHDFTRSPAAFIGVYLAKMRWNCETISMTHWGKILGGQFLVGSDFE